MKLGNVALNADVADVIETLRAELWEQKKYLFAKTMDSGEDLMVCCPYHKDGQERRPSAGIRKEDGLFHCLACGETHSLPEVVGHCFNSNAVYGYKWLVDRFGISQQQREVVNFDIRGTRKHVVTQNVITEEELDSYRYTHPYMYERGLTDTIIEYFDIGYDKDTRSITFPVRDVDGKVLFVARRSVKYKSFNIPVGVDKPLYGLFELSNGEHSLDKIYVCEGPFDCLRLWCNGKVAVAGFGCLFNNLQISQLNALPTRHLVLALDNDVAGQAAADRLKKYIKNKIITSVSLPPGRKDIGECTDEEIQNLTESIL